MIWNSAYYWGIPAKILHWVAAVLIVVVYVDGVMLLDDWDEHGGRGRGFVEWHAAAGMTVAVVMLARLMWRLVNRTPMMPAQSPEWEKAAAHAAHAALYVVTLLVTLSGWFMAAGLTPPLVPSLLWLLPVPSPVAIKGEWLKEVHEILSNLLIVLAVGHALAALWHHYIKGDSVLRRMLLRGKVRNR